MRTRIVALTLLLATSCTTHHHPGPDLTAVARARLAVLAGRTAGNAYDATYTFVHMPENDRGRIRIRQVPPRYRIDVTSKTNAFFFSIGRGVVSCTQKRRVTCFLVARKGEAVPELFDPGVQRLFRDAVEDLAANPAGYTVQVAPDSIPTTPGLPTGECFDIHRTVTPSVPTGGTGFEDGTYCFADQGVATSITVTSGTLTLVGLAKAPPPKSAFVPPAPIQSLPPLH